jgi:ketosteroid isomerase-like protein
MSSEDVVRALFDAFGRRDLDAALALAHPDVEFWPQGTAQRAQRTAPYRGYDGLRQYFADVAQHWDELRLEPGELRVAGDGVVAFGTAVGRPAGDEEEQRQPVIWLFKLREGRILHGRVVATAAEALAAAERSSW